MRANLFKTTSSAGSAGRPKTGQSNIRGKISGPIPISAPEDDEFPMRRPGTGLATPLDAEGMPQLQIPPEDAQPPEGPQEIAPLSDVAAEEKTESTAPSAPSQRPSEHSGSPAQRRTNRSSTLRYSTVSATTDTDQSRSTPQRKKSTIRSALSKIFGRNKKKNSGSSFGLETHHEKSSLSSVQHRSDPSALARDSIKEIRDSEPKRSVSLPITEFSRALRSHSVGPDDIIAIESARNSFNEPVITRRRAATASSRKFIRSREFGDFAGLSPRPASAQARESQDIHGNDDPENIGRAITSDLFMQHRRSRSLSQLQDAADAQGLRNRSDEIRYWRESYTRGLQSPASSNLVENEDTVPLEIDRPDTPMESNKPQTPPQPFNFGTVMGMKITQAASLEERIETLESRNQKLEKLVTQLAQMVPGSNHYSYTPERNTSLHPRAPSATQPPRSTIPNPTLYHTRTNDTQSSSRYGSSHSNESFGDGHTFVGSVPIPASVRPMPRPTSIATVRGATSFPTFPREAPESLTADHYTTLLALLETERSARQILEAQVRKLSNKLNMLYHASHHFDNSPGPTYSTFEHDDEEEETAIIGGDEDLSESEDFKTPAEERIQHGFGAFGEELKDEESDGSRKKAARTLSLSQLTLGKPLKSQQPEAGVKL